MNCKVSVTATLAIVVSMFSANALADQGGYFGIAGGLLKFDDGFESVEPKQLVARVGYDFNSHIGLGLEGSFSLITDEFEGVDYDVTTIFFYLKGRIPLGDKAAVYALVGSTDVQLTGTVDNFSLSADDTDTGTGYGFEFGRDEDGAFFVDYILYNDNDGVEVTSINIGYSGYF